MPPEIPGHNADTHRLRWPGQIGKRRRCVVSRHGSAHERAITRLQVAVVATLIGEVERQIGADRLGKSIEAGASDLITEGLQMLLVTWRAMTE